jgi:hypothetical protein
MKLENVKTNVFFCLGKNQLSSVLFLPCYEGKKIELMSLSISHAVTEEKYIQ